jgi:hypothetical protein
MGLRSNDRTTSMETNYDLSSALAALSCDKKSVAAYDVKSAANTYPVVPYPVDLLEDLERTLARRTCRRRVDTTRNPRHEFGRVPSYATLPRWTTPRG